MYCPSHFHEIDIATLHQHISDYPLATLIIKVDGGFECNLIPMFMGSINRESLQAHVARSNPLVALLDQPCEALAVFHGPQSYISPTFYPSKLIHGKVVPTWNYSVVEVQGRLLKIDDASWIKAQMCFATDHQESLIGSTWKVDDAPQEFMDQLINAVVGIELKIERISGKIKASQNQSDENKQGVIEGLRFSNASSSHSNHAMAYLINEINNKKPA